MTKHTFNLADHAKPVSEFEFTSAGQRSRAVAFNCELAFRFRDIGGVARNLPKYVLGALDQAGYNAHVLGGTTYKYSVIGLSKK